MHIFKWKSDLKRLLRYSFFVIFVLFLIVSVGVFYNYVRNSSEYVVSKWWTYVEWLTNTTSYLPYLNQDSQSYFYQSLLFRSCLDYNRLENWQIEYISDLCKVETKDNKEYTVTLSEQVSWSNGVPMSINDVYFTFQDILALNKLNFEGNKIRDGTEVILESDTIKVTFPNESFDNMLFFTNHILPKHVLLEPNIDMYKQDFAISPVYNGCAKIQEQSKDVYSLIFDLSECDNSNIGFYQLKQILDLGDFSKDLEEKWSIIDTYKWADTFTGYSQQELQTDKYAILFFNTDSNNMLVRTRRALWWFIKHNIDIANSNINLFSEYDWTLFNQFWSTWWNLEEFIDLKVWEWISIKSLSDSWVWEVPEEISIKNTTKAFLYYLPEEKKSVDLNLTFARWNYPKLGVQYMDWEIQEVKNYDSTKRTATYTISADNKNIQDWNNTYTIYWINGNTKDRLSTINLYRVWEADTELSWETNQFKVLYIDTDNSNYIINKLKLILNEKWISEDFKFEAIDTIANLEAKLLIWDYDMVLWIVDSTMREWFYKFITSSSVLINPTNYTTPQMSSMLKNYEIDNNDTSTVKQINEIYANDMPFVVLGTEKSFVNIKNTILNKLETQDLYWHENNWQDNIYKNLSLTNNVYVDNAKLWNIENFRNYLFSK